MKKGICIALITFGMLCGQEKKEPEKSEPPNPWASRVVAVENRAVGQFGSILGALGVKQQPSRDLKVIVLSGPSDLVAAAAKIIERLDVPAPTPKNIELMAYPIIASREPGQGSTVPPEREGVVKQLKGVFAYQGFRILDTMVLRVRDGENGEPAGPRRWGPILPGGPSCSSNL